MLHQQAADELRGNLLGGADEEGVGEGREVLVAMAWLCMEVLRSDDGSVG